MKEVGWYTVECCWHGDSYLALHLVVDHFVKGQYIEEDCD